MSTSVRSTTASLRVFLERLIDYAGLFPPASVDMLTSVNNYARYRGMPESWALGRFVLPVARLDEFLKAQENVATDPWRLSGIVSANVHAELAAVGEFNRKAPGAVIESVEVRVNSQSEIELVRKDLPYDTTVFFEIAPERAGELLPTLLPVHGECAKLRTGGISQEAFPAVEKITEFVARCAETRVPFKTSAGLHHPLCCVRPLTYEPKAQKGRMHGFLNLFTAAAIAWSAMRSGRRVPRRVLATCLADGERANWHFGEDALTWSGEEEPIRIELDALRAMRSEFALSFGSCSFEEPFTDMREFNFL
ncbi:MAG TPA: hypothetical protein VM578_04185 [Candidatus Saccharimonadales bacterium]|nr:hypothetical protein [Candidatus Saccharimonadales bacterium]